MTGPVVWRVAARLKGENLIASALAKGRRALRRGRVSAGHSSAVRSRAIWAQGKRREPWYSSIALWLAIPCLLGMAYCHIEDVGMKFDEHVYYMAGLFLCNIAASLLLIPALIGAYASGSAKWLPRAWAATGTLALLTICGFLWSRTIGFPQMADHIGMWDRLGITSLIFETGLVVLAVEVLGVAPRLSGIESMLAELDRIESPSGRAFFPSARERDELVRQIFSLRQTPTDIGFR
jgi:hypothetical protein